MKPLLQNPFLKEILNIQKKERPYAFYLYEDYARLLLRVHLTVPDKISRYG